MTILRDDARPLVVDSFAIAEHVGQGLALEAARRAATAHVEGSVSSCRMTLPYEGGWMRMMAATLPSLGLVGYKEFHIADGDLVRYAVHLFSSRDGRPLGVVDAALVTTLRTAASAAIAAEWFFGTDAEVRLTVIGSGAVALAGLRALNEVLHLNAVRVTSRSAGNRTRFASSAQSELGLNVDPIADPVAATAGADMAYVATNSGGEVVIGLDGLRALPFVASVGSTLPIQRELGDDVLASADDLILDTWDVLEESGDAIASAAHGLDRDRARLLGDMPADKWDASRGFTVYKSIGSPEQDIVLAQMILESAAERGFGRVLEPLSAIKQNLA
jgi:alanine dehydrogenase